MTKSNIPFRALSLILAALTTAALRAKADDPSKDFSEGATNSQNQSGVINPPRTSREAAPILHEATNERVQKLKHARVVYADYNLIQRDFRELAQLSHTEIDSWLVNQVGFISTPQTEQTTVNTQIATTGETRSAIRPSTYGRALLYKATAPSDQSKQIGYLDVKGAGSLTPAQESHGNGLNTLGECITDLVHETTTRELLLDAGAQAKNVGTYAILDGGFDVVHSDGSHSRAGLFVRQAHLRSDGGFEPPSEEITTAIYRRYGVDIAENFQAHQGIWDFGHYVYENQGLLGHQYLEDFAVPWKEYGYDQWSADQHPTKDRWYKSKLHRPWIYSHDTARYVENNSTEDGKRAIRELLTNLTGTTREKLASSRERRLSDRLSSLGSTAWDSKEFEHFSLDLAFLANDPRLGPALEPLANSPNLQDYLQAFDTRYVKVVMQNLSPVGKMKILEPSIQKILSADTASKESVLRGQVAFIMLLEIAPELVFNNRALLKTGFLLISNFTIKGLPASKKVTSTSRLEEMISQAEKLAASRQTLLAKLIVEANLLQDTQVESNLYALSESRNNSVQDLLRRNNIKLNFRPLLCSGIY